MDSEEILWLVTDVESDRVERRASLAEVDRVCEAICAFANDLPGHGMPGVVAIGVDDAGRASGVAVDDALLLRLANLRDNGRICPFPLVQVDRLCLGRCRNRRRGRRAFDVAAGAVSRPDLGSGQSAAGDRHS